MGELLTPERLEWFTETCAEDISHNCRRQILTASEGRELLKHIEALEEALEEQKLRADRYQYANAKLSEIEQLIADFRMISRDSSLHSLVNDIDKHGLIDDMLGWQERLDNSGWGGPNMKGSARFWSTVQYHLDRSIDTDGTPDFSEIVIQLTDNVGLSLYTDPMNGDPDDEGQMPSINYRFVDISEKEDNAD